ncbi:MAG: phenylalanine--tRNA ligase subunit beta, partial [Bacilli bacterium]|nr:phenylalanine--tRNA ligase subunit beta [Bacilli bacterium]
EKCSQFSARVVKGIKVGESPKWMKEALRSSGIRSINNIVDIGNYVMLLTGQPLHMYDMDKLAKQELVVRDDLEGDFVALDEKTYKLQKGDICITSNGKVMCLGGVMGSLECAVDENTKNVVVEAANFDYASIRRTSIRLALVSDSSQRFVKGINPSQWKYVQDMTASLLVDLCGAKEIGEVVNVSNKEVKPVVIESSADYINGRLGTNFSKETIVASLEAAWIKVTEKGDKLVCEIPAHRIDITGEADLSEEVIRINGFENIESKLPEIELSIGGLEKDLENKRAVRSYLRGLGIDEALCYSLVREKEVKSFAILNKGEAYKILNPLTDEHEYLRTNVLPSLLNTLSYNLNHGNENVAIFEVSDLFTTDGKKHIHLAIACVGNDLRRGAMSGEPYSYYHLKGVLDGLLRAYNIEEKRTVLERCKAAEFHPGKSAILKIDGKPAAVLGELHPNTLKELGLSGENVVVLEADLGVIFGTKTSAIKMNQISKYQTVKRDFAFVLGNEVTSKEVVNEIYKVNREVIKNVEVFDVYHGEHVKEGHYSLAVSVYLNDMNKTLGENDIVSLEQAIIKALETKFGAELRK